MEMSEQLRQRILRSLRWLVADTKWRYDEAKGDLDAGSHGGYSDELKEAMELLNDLEQGTIPLPNGGHGYTEQQCLDTGWAIGMTEEDSRKFFYRYSRQGWVFDTGAQVVDLKSAMNWWKLNNQGARPEVVKTRSGLTPLQQYYKEHKK